MGSVDLAMYAKAIVLLFRTPQIVLAPLLMGVAQVLLFMVVPGGGGFIGQANSGIAGLVAQILDGFGLAIALIVARAAWTRGRAPFDEAWEDGRRKFGDIAFAIIGLGFVIYVAGLAGSFLSFLGIVLVAVAYFFFIYTIPAAAIGGTPGGAALNASLELARRAPLPTFVVAAVFLLGEAFLPSLILNAITPLLVNSTFAISPVVISLITYAIKAVVESYLALVLAKTYDDVSYGRFYR